MRLAITFFILPLALAAASGGVSREVLQTGGRQHVYFVFVPAQPAGPAGAPMLMLLHGSGHDGRSILDPWRPLAEKEGIVLVAPNSQNSSDWEAPLDGPEPIMAIAEDVKKKHPVDARRVYLFGHSAGAAFALLMSLARPDSFAAIAVHAGALHPKAESLVSQVTHPTPLQIQVGTQDAFFPLTAVRHTRDLFVAAGFSVDLREIPQHDHNYYAIAAEVNRTAWAFLKDKSLTQ